MMHVFLRKFQYWISGKNFVIRNISEIVFEKTVCNCNDLYRTVKDIYLPISNFSGHNRLSAKFRPNEMGKAGRIGIAVAAWSGGSRPGTFIGQIGKIPSAMRRWVYSCTRYWTWCPRRWNYRSSPNQATFRNQLDYLQSYNSRQSVSCFTPTDNGAISETTGLLSSNVIWTGNFARVI